MEQKRKEEKLIEGKSTRQLSQLIPIENIRLYLNIYHMMKNIDIKSYLDNLPEEIINIRKSLDKLHKKKWLDEKDSFLIWQTIFKKLAKSEGGNTWENLCSIIAINNIIPGEKIKKAGLPKTDNAFDFLIYALIFDLKYYQNRPCYDRVLNFLYEQKIINGKNFTFTQDALKKRYQRLSFSEIATKLISCELLDEKTFTEKMFNSLQGIHWGGFFCEVLTHYTGA